MKFIILGFLALFLICLGIGILFGLWRTWKVQSSPLQKDFIKGSLPFGLDGLYKGSVSGLKTTWQGKKFEASSSAGINLFKSDSGVTERYPFKTYSGKGLQDNIQVLKIDYNLKENPLWLRFIVDELVQTAPNKYLGKLQVKLLPKVSFSLGFFNLEK